MIRALYIYTLDRALGLAKYTKNLAARGVTGATGYWKKIKKRSFQFQVVVLGLLKVISTQIKSYNGYQ